MTRVHIIGGKDHGKTTLVGDLVAELRSRGLRVGTIKHTHHHHELDMPGKDSHRHRESGAAVVGVLSRSMNAVFWPGEDAHPHGTPLQPDDRYASFAPAFAACDLVLVEGDIRTKAVKLEVWRAALNRPPYADELTDIRAIITDDPIESRIPILARSDVPALADFILQIVKDQIA